MTFAFFAGWAIFGFSTCDRRSTPPSLPLMKAAAEGDLEALGEAIRNEPEKINGINQNGRTALMIAAYEGHLGTVRALIEAGADIHLKDMKGHTALFRTAYEGRMGTAKLLIEAGADVDARSNFNTTALMIAVNERDLNTMRFFIQSGAQVDATANNGRSALMVAAHDGNVNAVLMLLEVGADIHLKDNEGSTALQDSASQGKAEIAKLLLQAGAVGGAGDIVLLKLLKDTESRDKGESETAEHSNKKENVHQRQIKSFGQFNLLEKELPKGHTFIEGNYCKSTQAVIFSKNPEIYQGTIPKPVATSIQSLSKNGKPVGSILYFEYGGDFSPADAISFLNGLLWGPEGRPTPLHPEVIITFDKYLIILCFQYNSPISEWLTNRLPSKFYIVRGTTYMKQSKYEQAIADFDRAIRYSAVDSKNATDFMHRADAYREKGKYGLAIANLNKAIALEPKFELAYNNRADAYLILGRLQKAMADVEIALRLQPNLSFGYATRGEIHEKMGQMRKACTDWRKARKLGLKPMDRYLRAKC